MTVRHAWAVSPKDGSFLCIPHPQVPVGAGICKGCGILISDAVLKQSFEEQMPGAEPEQLSALHPWMLALFLNQAASEVMNDRGN